MHQQTSAGVDAVAEKCAPLVAVVVPCYNEEEVLPETTARLTDILARLEAEELTLPGSFILYVDDGSNDATWPLIVRAHAQRPRTVAGIKLARNAGHQRALLAGIESAASMADCVVTIDADLQDDVEAIVEFVKKYREGYDVVYGVRKERALDTRFKRWTALAFYRMMASMGVDVVYNHADYRLMSRRVLLEFQRFGEVNTFIRGMVPLVGFPSTEVYYDRGARFAGESKYPLKKMLSFAADGITSFSVTPIRYIGFLGVLICMLSVLGAIGAGAAWGAGVAVPSWMYILVSLWFLAGLQLTALGIIGEYLGKTYQETKRRPRYVVETRVDPEVSA
jgi:polyisoprenyl-phosphate glycosyltransferase